MWLAYALCASVFAALSVIFAKTGIKRTDFEIVAAIKSLVILLLAWYTVFADKVQSQIAAVTADSFIHIGLVGSLLGGVFLCYHAALKYGDVTRVTATDRIGSVLILLSGLIIFKEESNLALRIIGIVLVAAGAVIMITGKGRSQKSKWLIPAIASSFLTAVAVVIARKELSGVNNRVALALCMTVALLVSLVAVFIRGIHSGIGRVPASEIMFAILSGVCICITLVLGNKALSFSHDSVSVAVMQLSSALSVLFAALFFKEKLSWKTACGLLLVVCGILMLIFLVGVYKF